LLVKLEQHYGLCFSVTAIYAKLDRSIFANKQLNTLSCLLAKIEQLLSCSDAVSLRQRLSKWSKISQSCEEI